MQAKKGRSETQQNLNNKNSLSKNTDSNDEQAKLRKDIKEKKKKLKIIILKEKEEKSKQILPSKTQRIFYDDINNGNIPQQKMKEFTDLKSPLQEQGKIENIMVNFNNHLSKVLEDNLMHATKGIITKTLRGLEKMLNSQSKYHKKPSSELSSVEALKQTKKKEKNIVDNDNSKKNDQIIENLIELLNKNKNFS
jgi:hypothetical protein